METLKILRSPNSTFLNLDQKKQQRIIKAAVEEFSAHGFRGASINHLVSKVGISKGSIFQYFRNKKGLFLFVFHYATDMVKGYLKQVRQETAEEEVFERIRRSLLAGAEFVRKHPKIYNVYLRIIFEGDIPFRRELIQTIRKLSIEYLVSLLQAGKERGEIDPRVDVYKAAFFLDSILDKCLQAYYVQHVDAGLGLFKASPETVGEWAREVTEFCRHGLTARPKHG